MVRCYFFLAVLTPLLSVLAVEMTTSQARITIMPPQLTAAKLMSPAAPNLRDEVAIVLARPLVSPLRRPVIAAPQPAAVPHPPRLSGIVVAGSASYAIFVPNSGNPMIAIKGELIGPFKIRDITATQVIMSGPNGILTQHTSYIGAASGAASQIASAPSKIQVPIILPGGITLYPATEENLPDAADWPGT